MSNVIGIVIVNTQYIRQELNYKYGFDITI